MRKPALTAALALLALTGTCRALDDFTSTTYASGAAVYLDLPAHAYGAALAGAMTAWRTDIAGVQWNPSLLEAADQAQLTGSFAFLTDDRRFQAVDLALPIGSFVVGGISFVNSGVGSIERRDDAGFTVSGDSLFGDQENTVAFSAAGRTLWNISVGARARYLYQEIDRIHANGFGFDAGATWTPDSALCVGVSLLNVGSRLFWTSGHADDVLTQGRIGVAYRLFNRQLVIEADGVKALLQPLEAALGIQYTLLEILSLRGGVTSSIDLSDWSRRDPVYSLGMGIRWSYFGADYSITIPSGDTEMITHRASVVLRCPIPMGR